MNGKILFGAGLALALAVIGGRTVTRPALKHFTPAEFGVWYPLLSAELLQKLDRFRELWGAPIVVSTAVGGIGRHGGDSDTSQHNVDKWGEVRALDVFPKSHGGGYIRDKNELRRAADAARAAGFTGIGVYTDTVPGFLVHVDVRPPKALGHVATWSRVGGQYLSEAAAYA